MNSAESGASAFRALVSSVSPSLISDFLNYSGWVLTERREGLLEYWLEPNSADHPAERNPLLLPLNEEMRDFDRRLAELLAYLAEYFDDDGPQLLQRINDLNWDTLVLRMESVDNDDSVHLIHATKTLDAGMEMLRMSTLYTLNPDRSNWRGNPGSQALEYLQEGVRLGHTRRGSFTFPILSRAGASSGYGPPLGRRVMMNFAMALARIHRWPDGETWRSDETSFFDISMAKSLVSAASDAGFNQLSVSFRWASSRPLPPAFSTTPLVFDTHVIESVKSATQRFGTAQRKRSPGSDTSIPDALRHAYRDRSPRTLRDPVLTTQAPVARFSGPVISIGIDDRNREHDESPFFVVLRTAHGDVWILVTEEEHDFAMRAHRTGQEVTAAGTLADRDARKILHGSLVRPDITPRRETNP
ncbi:hypothetical protein AB0P17_41645 [Streptomyces sp. NPDC088124]|uniref:hypothetical protein n=1 Tax=Streptomyces sp. NPDC088124 TaxID=3154654 RepID=UPI003426F0C6